MRIVLVALTITFVVGNFFTTAVTPAETSPGGLFNNDAALDTSQVIIHD